MQFSHFFEQTKIINSLIRIIDQGRVSHAQLFLGKYTSKPLDLAIAYAQYLNCTNKKRFKYSDDNSLIADSCGECPSCVKYSKLVHPDLHFIFPNTTTKRIDSKSSSLLLLNEFRDFIFKQENKNIDDWYEYLDVGNKQGTINVRDANYIINTLNVKPYEAEFKVVIVWMLEKLHHEAAPKLLKVLEEPSEKTVFLLIAEEREQILSTILSRTQLVKIPSLGNSILDGCNNADYLSLFVDWMRTCFKYKTKITDVQKVLEEIVKLGREEQKLLLSYANSVFHSCFLIQRGINSDTHPLEGAEEKFKSNFPLFVNENNIGQIYKEIDKAILHIERNGNSRMIFLDISIVLGNLLMMK